MADEKAGRSERSVLLRVWDWLVRMPEEDHEPEVHHQVSMFSRILAVVYLLVVAGLLVQAFRPGLIPKGDLLVKLALPGLIIVVFAYWLNGSGRSRPAALIFAFFMSGCIILFAAFHRDTFDPWPLMYMSLPLAMVSIYMPAVEAGCFLLTNLLLLCLLPRYFPQVRLVDIPLGFYIVMGGAIMVVKFYRQLLENIREAELQETRTRYRQLLEMVFEGVAVERKGRIVEANNGFMHIFGTGPDEVAGQPITRFLPGGLPTVFAHEAMGLHADGRQVYLEVAVKELGEDPDAPHMIALRDVSDRKFAELERARLHAAIAHTAESVLITDPEQRIVYVNPAFRQMTGYDRDEVIGKTPGLLRSGRHDAAFYEAMWVCLGRGEPWRGHFINQRKDETLYECESTVSPVFDSAGQLVNYVAVARDVTREVQLEAQYRQSQKMEAVGQLAGGVAHDFNNLLQAIRGYTEMVRASLPPAGEEYRELGEAIHAANRAASLVRQLLMFSRSEVVRCTALDLNEIVPDLLTMLRRLLGAQIDLSTSFQAPLKPVWADRGQIEQVLTNLCVNARDAMPNGGSLRVATRIFDADEAFVGVHEGAELRQYVLLMVTDTGEGMPSAVIEHIYEPFFTTKEVGKGTGLGLATVYGIVRQHKGIIEVSSEPGRGTEFCVYLPVYEGQEEAGTTVSGAASGAVGVRGRGETILVAEDDDTVRRLAVAVLEKAGFKVLSARDGGEAVDLFEKNAQHVTLVLLDVVMPRRSGREVAKILRGLRPELPVIYCSGHDFNLLGTGFPEDRLTAILHKPYSAEELLAAIGVVVAGGASGPPAH
jgi:PAS domain S-box-containing protein